jgi:light-regulated signal transduction histidine kinase (bacteriophytochrome)
MPEFTVRSIDASNVDLEGKSVSWTDAEIESALELRSTIAGILGSE